MIEIKFVKAIKGNFYHIYAENGKSWDLVGRYSNYAVNSIMKNMDGFKNKIACMFDI